MAGTCPVTSAGGLPAGFDVDDANLTGIETAALHEGGPLLKLSSAGGYGDCLPLQILRAPDVGFVEHDDGGRIAPEDAGDHLDAHSLGHAGPDHKAVREAELGR